MEPAAGRVIEAGYSAEDCTSSVGPGWAELAIEAWTTVLEMGCQVVQMKEKLGHLQVHTDHINNALLISLYKIRDRSGSICEACGAPGSVEAVGFGHSWLKCLCNPCREKAGQFLRTDGIAYHRMFWSE